MKLKVIIIPPDNAPNTDFFEHTLTHDEYHNDILIDYCNQYGVEANDIIAMTNIGKVQSYEEFILAFNNLKNKKEGIKHVR